MILVNKWNENVYTFWGFLSNQLCIIISILFFLILLDWVDEKKEKKLKRTGSKRYMLLSGHRAKIFSQLHMYVEWTNMNLCFVFFILLDFFVPDQSTSLGLRRGKRSNPQNTPIPATTVILCQPAVSASSTTWTPCTETCRVTWVRAHTASMCLPTRQSSPPTWTNGIIRRASNATSATTRRDWRTG